MKKGKNIKFNYSDEDLKSNFQIPEDYFKNLPGLVQNRIVKLENNPVKRTNIILHPAFKIAVAAVLVILLYVTVVNKNRIFSDSFNDLEMVDIIENYAFSMDEDFILSYIEFETDLYAEEEETDDEMINYLIDQGIEIEELINIME